MRNHQFLRLEGTFLVHFGVFGRSKAAMISRWGPHAILGRFLTIPDQKYYLLFGALLAHFLAHGRLMMHVSSFFWRTFSRLCFSSILGGLKALKLMLLGGGRHGWSAVNSGRIWVGQVFIQGWFLELSGVPSRLTFWGHFGSQILNYRHFGATLGAFRGSKMRV